VSEQKKDTPMTIQKNIMEAKTSLSMLVNSALAGEDVVIANRGVPAVRLVPVNRPERRALGFVGGTEHWDDAFFSPLSAEELALWEG
jgi:prevent-host-death family protein